jgi:hypothetical protein
LQLKEPVGPPPTLEHVRQRSAVPFQVVACVGLRGVVRVGGSTRLVPGPDLIDGARAASSVTDLKLGPLGPVRVVDMDDVE